MRPRGGEIPTNDRSHTEKAENHKIVGEKQIKELKTELFKNAETGRHKILDDTELTLTERWVILTEMGNTHRERRGIHSETGETQAKDTGENERYAGEGGAGRLSRRR